MADVLFPMLVGLFAAIPIVVAIRIYRGRTAGRRPATPEVPVSRQHRRAIERRASKSR